MNRVQIISDENEYAKGGRAVKINGTRCSVNNMEIPMVVSADFHVAIDEVPAFKFETCGRPDIDVMGRVTFDFSPENLSDACLILSEELKKHSDFYKAFVASVKSALTAGIDWTPGDLMDKKAEYIVRRIAGEE